MKTIDDGVLAGMGRADLVAKIHELHKGMIDALERAESLKVTSRFDQKRITELQERGTAYVHETRALRRQVADLTEAVSLAPLAFIVGALQRARAKHPGGPGRGGDGMRTLLEEAGEVASAMRKEGPDRVREELLDVIVVALRIYWNE